MKFSFFLEGTGWSSDTYPLTHLVSCAQKQWIRVKTSTIKTKKYLIRCLHCVLSGTFSLIFTGTHEISGGERSHFTGAETGAISSWAPMTKPEAGSWEARSLGGGSGFLGLSLKLSQHQKGLH